MTTSLHDRLADLASDAPPGGPAPGLWERGRRYHRQRRTGTLLVTTVVVVMVGLLAAATWQRSVVEPVPAAPPGDVRLPTEFYAPSRWLPTTQDSGPLGRLVAVVGSEGGPVGVSAREGEYRRLGLPGWSQSDEPLGSTEIAVSADGRWVGYWYVDDGRVVGVAAYDAVLGEVTRHDVASDFGLNPNGLVWLGDRLWFSAYAFTDDTQTSARGYSTTLWSPGDGTVREVPLEESPGFGNLTTTPTSVIEPETHRVSFYAADGASPRSLRVRPSIGGRVAVSPDERRMAAVLDPTPSVSDGARHGLVVLTPDGRGGTVSQRVPGVRTNEVIAWRDDQHVVVYTYVGDGGYQAVDITTGEAQPLTSSAAPWTPGLHVAQDAWSAPTYDAPPPPDPLDPRLGTGAVVTIVLLGGLTLLWWRRRVRP